MFNTTLKAIFASAIVLVGITAATAQIDPQSKIATNVPFSFVVDGKTYPAGDYTFERLDTTGGSDSTQLVMRGPKGASVIINTVAKVSVTAAAGTHLVFEKVAGQQFLSEIWGKGQVEGNELLTASAEKKAIAAAATSSAAGSTSGVDGN